MFRRARLSVKPNVRPGVGTRGSAAPNPQRGPEAPRPPEPAPESAPKPAEPTDVPAVDSGGAELQEQAPGSSDEKTGDETNAAGSSTPSSAASQRRKRVPSTTSPVQPPGSAPSQSRPSSTVNHDAPQPNPTPAKEKQPCSDRYQIYKARKLREMLKEELRKEKKQWKNKFATNESHRPPDRSKMTMRDFIYYLPDNNPMTSSVEQEKKTEKPLAPTPTRDRQENQSTQDANDNEEVEEEVDDGPLLVPRVKVAEDGSIILDEESLTVEVLRTKGPRVVEENDPIFERGSTTTYSSFRKNYYSKPWSNKETDMFFLAISMVGTDFSMIGQLFPHRARIEIKNKFKREEKTNGWRIDKAFQEKRPFDFDFFAHLLQKVLAEEEKRKQKSTKFQNSKEKASKPRKNVKAKTVTSEAVNADPDVSVNSNISDPEGSQKDAQIVDEEESPSSSGQHLEQAVLEQDQNQEKKRRRTHGEAGQQEATYLLERVLVHPSPPEAGTHEDTCPFEENESNCNKEQIASFTQNIDDIAGLASSEEMEMRMDPIPSTSHQQDIMPLASESSESCAVDLSVSEPGRAASADTATAESSCSEGRSVGLNTESPETEQIENVKPKSRSRLLRPKPNLSRAVGKKSALSHDRQDERNKNSPSETAAEQNHMGKERVNESENFVAENTDRESPGAETVSDLSEKSCVQEDSQAKVLRPTRLMRSRMQRPKPNIVKAAARKEILPSQDKGGGHGEKGDDGSCVVVPPQVENESHKNLQYEDTVSQPDKKDPFENKQSDQLKVLNECPSIQEGNKGNKLKQTPVLRTRFQKPKPNTGRRRRRRRSSKEGIPEETPVSGEITASWEEIPGPDVSPREEVLSVPLAPLTATASTTGLESDGKDSGRNDRVSNVQVSEMMDVTMEVQTGLETVGRDTCPGEMGAEMIDIPMETEAGLKASLDETSPMEKVPELIDTTGEICTNLGETGRKIFLRENGPKEVSPVSEPETGLQETGKELAMKESTPDMMSSTEERETYSEETERQEISAPIKDAEGAKARGEMETPLGETEGGTSQREEAAGAPVEQSVSEENPCGLAHSEEVEVESGTGEGRELSVKETGEGDNSLMTVVSGEKTTIEETNGDSKETKRESSVSWERGSEEIHVGEAVVADLGKPEEIDVSPRDHEPEKHSSGQPEADVIPSGRDGSPGSLQDRETISKISVMPTLLEEEETSVKDVYSHLCHVESSSQNSGSRETDQGMQLPDSLEQFSDINLSKPLPQEQKSLQVKPTPFLRSRFKKPKPNLSRAALKRATIEAEHCVPGKKSEAYKMETVVLQQDGDQAASLSCEHNVPSLMASGENDKPGQDKEEAVILPCIQAEKDPSPPNAWEPKEDFQLTQTQEHGSVVPIGTQMMNIVIQETKQNVVQTTLPVRGRLQRPRPNVQRARQRQIVGKGEAGGIAKNEGPELQNNDETKACLTVANSSQIENEVAIDVSSRDSECGVNESQGHVAPVENLSINNTSVVQEQIRHENKRNVPSPALLIRRRFQKAKPNLGGARHKGEQPGGEKGQTDESAALTPEDRLPQKGVGDTQLSLQATEKTEMPLEVSVRKECVHSEEWSSDRDDAQPKAGPPGGTGGEMGEGQPASSSGLEEQSLRKQVSRPQLLKESSSPKTVPHQRTAPSSSECEIDHSGKRTHRKMKPNVTKGRGSKRIRGKTAKKEPRASKSMLVTLRASQKEDEDDAEDFDSDYEEETYHLAPEELNKAPVFVPVGLRSPEPVSAQIEETMEELEITMDVPDMGCVTVVEHQLSHTDAATQGVQPEKAVDPSPFEMVIDEQTQEEPGPSDGSTEAAITLLTMGDIVLQSEIIPGQGDVGVCVFPDVHSKDKSHVPFSPDNVNQKIVHDYQEVCSPVISMSHASFEENKIVSKEQSNQEAAVMEEAMEETLPTRSTASTMSTHLRTESMVATPKPNSEKILEICELGGPQEAASLCITKGTEVEIQRETEGNDSKAVELEDESLEPVTTAETKEQRPLLCVHDGEGAGVSQEADLPERIEDHENLQELLLGAVVASSETGRQTLDSGLGERAAEEALEESPKSSGMAQFHATESVPSNIPEAQQENTSPQDVTVNLFANGQQDGEDEQAFILTLVEIPASATQEFADDSMQLTPSSLLPAPILVRSGRTSGRGDLSGSLQASSVVQDATCLSPSRNSDSEKPPVNLDLKSRKRFCCSPDESIHVPPAKKSSIAPGIDYQECTSEVCSEELNVFEKTVESCMGQDIFPTSESTHATSKPQKEHNEPTFQNTGSSGSLDEIKDACVENTMTQLPQSDKISEKEEKTEPASSSQQRDSGTSSSKPPLTRPGRRPLGFLSLICPKNSLESDEVTQTHNKKRLKPQIPVSRRNLRKPNPLNASQKKNQESSDPLPSPSVTDTPCENTGNSESSAAQVSSDQPLLEEKSKNGPKGASEEEVTPVSEFVFSDIFIEVDETE